MDTFSVAFCMCPSSKLDTILAWNDKYKFSKNIKKQVDAGNLIYDKRDLKPYLIRRDKEGHFILIKGKSNKKML